MAFNQFPYSNFHISIHAPREGGDALGRLACRWTR